MPPQSRCFFYPDFVIQVYYFVSLMAIQRQEWVFNFTLKLMNLG